MPRPSSKDAILDAVEQIVAERGAAHLTLDAVAQQCGISKGGLMYNFPTKDALIQAMLNRFLERHEERREETRVRLGPEANPLLIEISALLHSPTRGRVSTGLLAVIANDPALLQHIARRVDNHLLEIASASVDAEFSQVLFFAAFGMHFHDLLQLGLLSKSERERLRARLLEMAREEIHHGGNGKTPPGQNNFDGKKQRGRTNEKH